MTPYTLHPYTLQTPYTLRFFENFLRLHRRYDFSGLFFRSVICHFFQNYCHIFWVELQYRARNMRNSSQNLENDTFFKKYYNKNWINKWKFLNKCQKLTFINEKIKKVTKWPDSVHVTNSIHVTVFSKKYRNVYGVTTVSDFYQIWHSWAAKYK